MALGWDFGDWRIFRVLQTSERVCGMASHSPVMSETC